MRKPGKKRLAVLSIVIILIIGVIWLPKLAVSGSFSSWIFAGESAVRPSSSETVDQNLQLMSKLADLSGVQAENEALRQTLNFKERAQKNLLVTYITSHELLNRNLVNLNVGSDAGVKIGQPIIVGDGVVIGKILRVQNNKAVAELLTSDFSKLAAMSIDANSTSGLVVGELGSTLALQFIKGEVDLKSGDLIITSGREDAVPAGLIVGTVEKIVLDDSDIFRTAEVKPAAHYDQQRLVSVIIDNE